MIARLFLAAAALLVATPVVAEWRQATSRHFIVYADHSEKEVRALTQRLEHFDALLRLLHTAPEEAAKPANRLTVFVVGGEAEIQRLCGNCRDVAGFYVPRASGAVVFTPKSIGRGEQHDINAQLVLFHEYAHHFLQAVFTDAYPPWFLEGYPEYVSTVRFEQDKVIIGHPAFHRVRGLQAGPGVSLETLFSPAGRTLSARERESVYGRGWLLTHMVKTEPARAAQLNTYLGALNRGVRSLDAAKAAFGDLKTLDRAMRAYLDKPFQRSALPLGRLGTPVVNLRPLTAGEAAMIGMRMISTRGVDTAAGAALFARAAPVAARFPNDAFVQGWFAEMAFDARRDDDAEAAADRAIAADPGSMQALLYKADVRLRRATTTGSSDPKVWREARSWIVRANKNNPDEAAPLVLFHRSLLMARDKPTAAAIAGLYRAMDFVPQDKTLRMMVARQALIAGKLDDARYALRSIAYDPHAAPDNPAAKLLALLDTKGAAAAIDALASEGEIKPDEPIPPA